MRWWPWRQREREQPRNTTISIGDPKLVEFFNLGAPNYSGISVGEGTALGLSAVYRAVSLISGTIASLPLRTLRDTGDGMRERLGSVFDNPGGPHGPTRFEWVETILCHLLLHGNAYLAHVYNAVGRLVALVPVHPMAVSIEVPRPGDNSQPVGGKWFVTTADDGTRETYDATTMTHIPGLCFDGIRGLSMIAVARNSLGTAVAGERAAAKMFSDGALMSGVLTPDDDVDAEEALQIKDAFTRNVMGWENASSITVVNRKMKFTPWSMSAEDAQFLQSRQFGVEEVSRWSGVPPHLLAQTDKQTSWGTGVAEQNRGLARTVLAPWAKRIEERLSRLLTRPVFVEFDFVGLERGSPEQEIDLLLKQCGGPFLTVNEVRAIRNLPPIEGGNVLLAPNVAQEVAEGESVAA
jgi:HK97 family phage portal protein